MPLAKRVRLAVPQAKEIWEFSQLSDQLNPAVKRVLDFEEKYQNGLDAGLVTMKDVIRVTKAPVRRALDIFSDVCRRPNG